MTLCSDLMNFGRRRKIKAKLLSPMSKFLKIGCLTLVVIFFIGLSFIAGLGVGAIGSAVDGSEKTALHKRVLEGSGNNQVALMSLDGVILSGPSTNPLSVAEGTIIPQEVGQALSLILEDESIKAVVLSINSPGGSAVASDEIFQHIKNTAAKKPVVILLSDTAASGGYFIASAGNYIFANPATLTGSIGVIAEITDVQELFKKIGLKQETYKSGEFKDLFSGTRLRTPEEKAMIQELLDTTYGLFVKRVAEGRKMEINKVLELADGKVYSGVKAKELGLIDELGYRHDAFEKAKQLAGIKDAELIGISTKSFIESLFGEIRGLNPLTVYLPQFLSSSGIKYLYKSNLAN